MILPRSLGARIAAGVAGITAVVVLVGAVGTWLAAQTVLVRAVDRELAQRGERTRRFATSQRRLRLPPPPPPGETRNEARGPDRHLMQVLDAASGREALRSAAMPEGTVLADPGTADGTTGDGRLADGRRVRFLVLRLPLAPPAPDAAAGAPPAAGESLVVMAEELAPVDDELARLATMLAALWAASTLLAWLAALPARRAMLRPLRELEAAIDRIGPDDLAARVPDAAGPAEVQGMVARLNGLIGRLEQAFRREQSTIAAIAHELRTPVAALRTALEFRLRAASGEDERRTLDGCLATVVQMQGLVANLLLLARLEAGREPLQRERCDLAALAADALEPWEGRGRALRSELPERAAAETSPAHLRLVLDNLLGNAMAHGDPAGAVTVAVRAAEAAVVLTVENPFRGSLDARHLGEAFYRGDEARSGGDHSGLGLALCRRLCRLLGAELRLEAADGRFRAEVRVPATEGAGTASGAVTAPR